jgi:2-oxo-3-hexenedioate decarboxylase
MNEARVDRLARRLLDAYDGAFCIALPSSEAGGLTIAEAYAVAERLRVLRVARGERTCGWKIGFTNRTLWERYGVDRPMWAPVYEHTVRADARDAHLSLQGLSQPRIEPEIVFGLRTAPRAGMTLAELHACIDWVAHGFEIVHTHFENWRFTAADTAADFALHGALFIGTRIPALPWSTLAEDLAALRVELLCDGALKDQGEGRRVLDGPLQALKALVDSMAAVTPHWHVAAGDVVTTGTLSDAWPLAPGQRWTTRLSEPRLSALALETAP